MAVYYLRLLCKEGVGCGEESGGSWVRRLDTKGRSEVGNTGGPEENAVGFGSTGVLLVELSR